MKYFPLIWSGLWRKPTRVIFTLLSLMVAFLLFGALQGLSAGFDSVLASAKLDRMFTDPRFFGSPLSLAYTDQIASVPGVRLVAPRDALFGYYQEPKNNFGVITSDERFFSVRDEITITPQQIKEWRATRDALVVGVGVAKRYNLKVGDPLSVHAANMALANGSRDFLFHVVAVVDDETNPGDSGFVVANYEYVNDLRTAGKNQVTRFLLRIDEPNHAPQIAKEIDKLFANSPNPSRTQSDRVSTQSGLGSLGDINFFVNAVVGSVLFMLLFLTTNTMMQSFRERIPEFAVLMTLGFSDETVTAIVIGEALIQCLLGAAAGLGLGKLVTRLLHGHVNLPAVVLQVPLRVFVVGLGLSVIVALVSIGLPALRARKLDVVTALGAH